mmetsp:Transcript_39887/g.69060  ORF Transcript_39887/g.69060 Transcript_39887/m.69060 type:complete len:559 (+) Transcript_39887:102-1778(+)
MNSTPECFVLQICPNSNTKYCVTSTIVLKDLEEAQFVLVVRDQHVLGVAVVVKHHLVVLSAETGLFVSTKRSVGRVGMVVVYPHTAGLDGTRHLVHLVGIAGPHASAKAVDTVVGDRNSLFGGLEGGHRSHRAEDLLLEDAHLVVSLEDRRSNVVTAAQLARELVDSATGQHLRALGTANVEVALDAVELLITHLRAHHDSRVERVADLDGLGALNHTLHELLVDALVHQEATGAGADLALVQRKQHGTFNGLVEEGIIVIRHGGEEEQRRLATELHGHRDEVLGSVLHDDGTSVGGTGERNLAHTSRRGQSRAGILTVTSDHVEHTRRQQVTDKLHQHHDGVGGLLSRLENNGVTSRQSRGNLPGSHQERKVPGDDLAHHAQRLVEADAHHVLVELGDGSLVGADHTSEVTEVVHDQGKIGSKGLTDGLAVIHGLNHGKILQVLLDGVGDLQQDVASGGRGSLAPGRGGGMSGIQSSLDISLLGKSSLSVDFTIDGGDVVEVFATDRGHELAVDEVIVLGLELRTSHELTHRSNRGALNHRSSSNKVSLGDLQHDKS